MAISARQRRKLPKSAFGVPSKRKYPVVSNTGKPSAKRARNALTRVAQHGTSAEKAAVRRKVAAKYPSIKVSGLSAKRAARRKKR